MITKRLREARQALKISQKQLGIQIGLPDQSASARMNQYEKGSHTPSFEIVQRIASITQKPVGWFYTSDDGAAQAQLEYHQKQKMIELSKEGT